MGSGKWLVWIAGAALAFGEPAAAPGGDVKTQLWGTVSVNGLAPDLSIKCGESSPCYPWNLSIVSTVFWVGETGSGPSNTRSAWNSDWLAAYGGVDDPVQRKGFEPAAFRPRENPFYVALPYCDMQAGQLKVEAARVVPWYITAFHGPGHSVCKGRWLEIRHGFNVCYAQWEDAGPFRTDSAAYVFGGERPAGNANHGAGIDVSPAVHDCLGLRPLDLVDWRFVEQAEVPAGPWSLYDSEGKIEAVAARDR